jgi:Uma2 family endonuclease
MDDSRSWPRYELLDGELLVTPAPGWLHQMAIQELTVILRDYCDREPIGIVVNSPSDLELEPGTITQPDIFVVPNSLLPVTDEHMGWDRVKALVLAVEVISPSSVRTDRVRKREFYLDAGVPEYWVVDLDARMIEVWTPGRATPVAARDVLQWRPLGSRSELSINVAAYFDQVRARLRRR